MNLRQSGKISPNKRSNIAVLLDLEIQFGRGILKGMMSFALSKKMLNIHTYRLTIHNLKKQVKSPSNVDGIIVHAFNSNVEQCVSSVSSPVVLIGSNWGNNKIPAVTVNDVDVGRMAGKYFIERGFENYGYFGDKRNLWSNERESGFKQILEQHNYVYKPIYQKIPSTSYSSELLSVNDSLFEYLLSAPKPLAIFSFNDYRGLMVSEACRQLDIHVPEEVSILGVDNDHDACLLTYPPLSSIDMPRHQIGYEAMKMLYELLSGRKLVNKNIMLDPLDVIHRQSSDIMATDDPVLVQALRFIRENSDKPITVNDICDKLFISRRKLENLMKHKLQRSPLQEINRAHVEKAKKLLRDTNLKMPNIASASGFNSPERLSVVFHRLTGFSPRNYRRHMP